MQVSNSTNLHHTHTDALHHQTRLCKCRPLWASKIHNKNTKLSKTCWLKLVLNRNKYSSSSLTLMKLHWLPIQQRIKYKTSDRQPSNASLALQQSTYKTSLIQRRTEGTTCCSNNNGIMLQKSEVKYKIFATRPFKYSAPTLWNQLPRSIRDSPNLDKP